MMRVYTIVAACLAATLLGACGSAEDTAPQGGGDSFVFPESLSPFGVGYPDAGDPCLQIGESAAVADYLDDSAILVGCPSEELAAELDGGIVATVDGVTLVSIPTGDANAGMEPVAESEDALVPGTQYHATTTIPCTGGAMCDAGVIRGWGEDGTTLVEVTKPDGTKRAIFFTGTTPTGADSAQADGSAGWDFTVERDGDVNVINFGPETYTIVDALVVGG